MVDDDPLPLRVACELYPQAKLTPSTLRKEAQRGRLLIFRLGKRDYTTRRAMQEMVRKCQDAGKHRACASIEVASNGLSETERVSSAQAALKSTVIALRRGLPNISGKSISRKSTRSR